MSRVEEDRRQDSNREGGLEKRGWLVEGRPWNTQSKTSGTMTVKEYNADGRSIPNFALSPDWRRKVEQHNEMPNQLRHSDIG